MRPPLVVGNWKMNTVANSASALASRLKDRLRKINPATVVVCPPFTSIPAVISVLENTEIEVGAQDCHWQTEGAFTGEISPDMLVSYGCKWVIIGHSERRAHLGETDAMVSRKAIAALKAGLEAIVCVGETMEERRSGKTTEVVKRQITEGIGAVSDIERLTIAYEPIWAIGTGVNATPDEASDIHSFIRDLVSARWGRLKGDSLRIIYGGSVSPENCRSLWEKDEIDGFLVGGASLKADSFAEIVESVK